MPSKFSVWTTGKIELLFAEEKKKKTIVREGGLGKNQDHGSGDTFIWYLKGRLLNTSWVFREWSRLTSRQ